MVVDELQNGLLRGHQPSIDLIVLGSWHEPGNGWHNRSVIVDGFGEEVASHDKVLPYRGHSRAKYRVEDIGRGDRITFILGEDQIVAIGICRDLCDRTGRSPLDELDVDLVLVPSHGNEATMRGHQGRAATLFANFGTQVFVVQHPMKPMIDGLGYVLRPSDAPDEAGACVIQRGIWAKYDQLTDT